MTQTYIGSKQITAWNETKDGQPGYAVKYPDGYMSWSPADAFEKAYFGMGENSDDTKVNEGMVKRFIKSVEFSKQGSKTTVGCATLLNGFEIVESSSCVDPENYDHKIGSEIVEKRIVDRVWMLLGFLLACARQGVNMEASSD